LNPHPQYRPDVKELLKAILDQGQIRYPFEELYWPVETDENTEGSDPAQIPDDSTSLDALPQSQSEPEQRLEQEAAQSDEAKIETSQIPLVSPAPESETEPSQPPVEPEPIAPVPERKPVPDYQRYHYTTPKPEKEELSSLKKTFRTLVTISIFIVIFVVVKYVILAPRPQFDTLEDEPKPEETVKPTLTENVSIAMISVAADTLVMGSINPEADANEFPLLIVPLSSFLISATEITQAQWNMVYETNPAQFRDPDLPVENVSFYDAVEFCNAKSLKDGLKPCYDYSGSEIICDFQADGYRLPTEAEWEFAAKAGNGKNFLRFSGSDNADEVGWSNANSGGRSRPVASKAPNALGLHDMSGNVFEWVWNWYAPYTYNVSSVHRGPAHGTDKVIRGGSWYHSANAMRTTARSYA
ncbi:MAG TPA: SUMF1/EgtB/PvdO family nonheme iron enzyme, partial [Candidatus Cloacimonadota bacterium]|nr:SUMF1/EgtB/PvdO family nonheme iron enzyme [Candidatus Cloacimonadota bacterium]